MQTWDSTHHPRYECSGIQDISVFSDPLLIDGIEIPITISIGVAIYPEHGKTDQDLLNHADKNMYLAKKRGKNQFVV